MYIFPSLSKPTHTGAWKCSVLFSTADETKAHYTIRISYIAEHSKGDFKVRSNNMYLPVTKMIKKLSYTSKSFAHAELQNL